MIIRRLKDITKLIIKELEVVTKYLKYTANKDSNLKAIYFNLNDSKFYSRHLYVLTLFAEIEGYKIIFPKSYQAFKNIYNGDIYLKKLITNNKVSFISKKQIQNHFFEISDSTVSIDFFTFLKGESNNSNGSYCIPMTQHPIMYESNYWKEKVKPIGKVRKKSIFMIGSFHPTGYLHFNEEAFKMLNRNNLHNEIRVRKKLTSFNTIEELNEFILSNDDKKCILIDANDDKKYLPVDHEIFFIPSEELRSYHASFYFFLAFAGFEKPHSHNLIEALSVGSIPFIHSQYANLMSPPMEDNINCIFFNDPDDLIKQMEIAFDYNLDKLEELSKNALNYYNSYLTPEVVLKRIMDTNIKQLYIQSHDSIKLFLN
jgi:hypothetical protein